MTGPERGFLLLSSHLGDPNRRVLTTAQMRTLADRSWHLESAEDRELEVKDVIALGYGADMAQRIVALLSQEEQLDYYLRKAAQQGCVPLTRISGGYPMVVRRRLGLDSPGVLWAKGDLSILEKSRISLVGSRDLCPENRRFAREVGRQAALQGYALVSGNARGADKTAQDACLEAGGQVIAVVADDLRRHEERENVLLLSEESYDQAFSSQRALSRNRIIHSLGEKTLVAQCNLEIGGTWDGTVKNLKTGWSPVFVFQDGSEASVRLIQMGAQPVHLEDLPQMNRWMPHNISIFDQ